MGWRRGKIANRWMSPTACPRSNTPIPCCPMPCTTRNRNI
jgi:hypothetical protein